MFTEIGVNGPWSWQHWIRKAPRVWSDSWHPQTRNLRSIGSQRILGRNTLGKKMAFSGRSYLSHAWLTKWHQNHQENHQCYRREENTQAMRSQQYLCCPEVHWSFLSETILVGICLIWRHNEQALKTRSHSLMKLNRRTHAPCDRPGTPNLKLMK